MATFDFIFTWNGRSLRKMSFFFHSYARERCDDEPQRRRTRAIDAAKEPRGCSI